MSVPTATYRLQLRNGVGFADVAELAPYLSDLGISHVYLSPIFRAAPGSTHGYDAVDFNVIDSDLGGIDGFYALVEQLRRFQLKVIVDFVPNHMAAHPQNPWWHDVLQWGRKSRYRDHFDIDWSAPKVLCPILGKPYGECLNSGEIRVVFSPGEGAFRAQYFEHCLPLCPATYGALLSLCDDEQVRSLATEFVECTPQTLIASMARLAKVSETRRGSIEAALNGLNGDSGRLHGILEAQPWRLSYWRTARDMLTYRRFFEISDLVGVRVEAPNVFADVHRTILNLVLAGKIDGLRIDHIDGLADPKGYLENLRRATAAVPDLYLVVEKILGNDEEIRTDWPIDGTTGYEFIRDAANFFVSADLSRIGRGYDAFTSTAHDYAAETLRIKRQTLSFNLAAELEGLVRLATTIADADIATRDWGRDTLQTAIIELASHFSIYRTYLEKGGACQADLEVLRLAARLARESRKIEDPKVIDFVLSLLLGDVRHSVEDQASVFRVRFQQTTGPLMAKAVEDTEFYRFNRLIALNEVGGDPVDLKPGADRFHEALSRRQALSPRALSATATHDTKRGEDARARLYLIGDIQDEWCASVARWNALPRDFAAPDRDMQWLFYQALAGAWPAKGAISAEFVERMNEYMIKAAREAKRHTSWTAPEAPFEEKLTAFVRHALAETGFVEDFRRTIASLVKAGAALSLAQTVLKVFAPGVPDIYQGTELWDLSLVDPDNRRPVDFAERRQLLARAIATPRITENVWDEGALKLAILQRSLAVRRRIDLTEASYEPLRVDGLHTQRAIAFMRRHRGGAVIIIIAVKSPRDFIKNEQLEREQGNVSSITVSLPEPLPQRFFDVLSGTFVEAKDHTLEVGVSLRALPVAVLISEH